MMKVKELFIMRSESKAPFAPPAPGHEDPGSAAVCAPIASCPPQRVDARRVVAHDTRYWEAVDRLEFFDPAG
ncbi:hypothetical protein GALL_382450 [mine drainage metagenome]|uniref:Uncharacterized protein n=1 Tax=mine drainage metagenome TaxID=410659 RepID=A0A1J5QR90_9ZZZZ